MGNDNRKKERQRLKRREKLRIARRAEGLNPYRKFAAHAETTACYINSGWQETGMASMLVLKRTPANTLAFGAYLVDIWCVGLKDAWGRINVMKADFDEAKDRFGEHQKMTRVDPATAWRLVAGGVRFARQNGFRLPPHYERWVSLLGNKAETATADLTGFGIEGGKLRYVGTIEDLEERLIGCRVDDFLKREDVEFIIGDEPWSEVLDDRLDEKDGLEEEDEGEDDELLDEEEDPIQDAELLDEAKNLMRQRATDAVRKWCFAKGIQPHPRLEEAVGLILESIVQVQNHGDDGEEMDTDKTAGAANANMAAFLSLEAPSEAAFLQEGLDQIGQFMNQFQTPEEMISALGLDALEE